MMRKKDPDLEKLEQDLNVMADSYLYSKRYLKETMEYPDGRNHNRISNSRYIVAKVENVIRDMDENSRIILEHEVMERKKNKWYEEYFSTATYYRSRHKAYRLFLREIEK